jgi:5-formyltetrahydrofolate cyclo-ligase
MDRTNEEASAEAKRAARAAARAAVGALTTCQRALASAAVCARVMGSGAFARARSVMVFAPLPDEVDLTPVLLRCRQTGRRVCAGRPDWETRSMVPAEVADDGKGGWSALVTTRFGVREPAADAPRVDPAEIDVIMVPALAFDHAGHRLGRGGGFYDRFLARREVGRARIFGVGFGVQLVAAVPRAAHDRPVDAVITEARLVVRRWDR